MRTNDLGKDILKGAIAGAAATYLMNRATTWLYEHEAEPARERENAARGGQTAYVNMAQSLARTAGVSLDDDARTSAGTAIHWATGIAAGMKYALLRRYWPDVTSGFGLAYGAAFFLMVDELMNPLFGFTPGPAAFPWQTHARGLGGHLVFGASTDAALRVLDRAA